jgi:hypothetical protein
MKRKSQSLDLKFGVIHKKVDPAQGIFLSLCKIWGMNKLKRIIEGPAELTKVS